MEAPGSRSCCMGRGSITAEEQARLLRRTPGFAGINPVLPRGGLVDRPPLVWRHRWGLYRAPVHQTQHHSPRTREGGAAPPAGCFNTHFFCKIRRPSPAGGFWEPGSAAPGQGVGQSTSAPFVPEKLARLPLASRAPPPRSRKQLRLAAASHRSKPWLCVGVWWVRWVVGWLVWVVDVLRVRELLGDNTPQIRAPVFRHFATKHRKTATCFQRSTCSLGD
jgi:hypothetical protein